MVLRAKKRYLQCSTCVLHFAANRPKHLLVYINPYGGKQRGKQIYDQKVAPIFSQASISTDVIGEDPSAACINI